MMTPVPYPAFRVEDMGVHRGKSPTTFLPINDYLQHDALDRSGFYSSCDAEELTEGFSLAAERPC